MNLNDPLSVEEVELINKLLHRMVYPVQEYLTPKEPKKGRSLCLAPLTGVEISQVNIIFNKLLTITHKYKEEMRAKLKALGSQGYLEGDGILRISNTEWRVFIKTKIATEYVGTYETSVEARKAWLDKKEISTSNLTHEEILDLVDIYVWIELEKFHDGVFIKIWEAVQWVDLVDDIETQKYVMDTMDTTDPVSFNNIDP